MLHGSERPLWIRDDQWSTVAAGFVYVGILTGALTFLPDVEKGVGIAGLLILLAGVWILARPIGLVIEPGRLGITIRSFVSERRLSFADLSDVEIREARTDGPILGLPGTIDQHYDLVLRLRDGDEVTVRRDLSLSEASSEAHKLQEIVNQ